MARFNFIFYSIILLSQVTVGHTAVCGMAEEGRTHRIACSLQNPPSQSLIWKLQINSDISTISECSIDGRCNNTSPDQFIATISTIGDHYESQLTINRVDRSLTRFSCLKANVKHSDDCNLQVYVSASPPVCDMPELLHSGADVYIKVLCSADGIYPRGECAYTYKSLPNSTDVRVTPSNTPSTTVPGNYKTSCELLVPLAGLPQGGYQFKVEIYPDLTSWVESASVYGEWTPSLTLSYPLIDIDSDCPVGPNVRRGYDVTYIMGGTTAACRCYLLSKGNPYGYAQWYDGAGNKVGTRNTTDLSCLLVVEYNSTDPQATYVCRAESILSRPDEEQNPHYKKIFGPKFAVGPTIVNMAAPDSFDLCPADSQMVFVSCIVPGQFVSPTPKFTLVIQNETIAEGQRGQYQSFHNHYILEYYHRPISGGSLRVYCKAVNGIFDILHAQTERLVIVRAPPQSAPILETSDNQPAPGSVIGYVSAGSDVHVTCRVDGGFPEVSNVTVICGKNMNTQDGSLALITLRIPEGTTEVKCLCKAQHVTGCYNKKTEIVLRVSDQGAPINDSGTSGSSEDGNDSLSIGLGVGLGCAFLLIAVLAVVTVYMCRREGKMNTFCNKNIDTYDEPDIRYTSHHQYMPAPPDGVAGPPRSPLPPPPDDPDQNYLIPLDSDHISGTHNTEIRGTTSQSEPSDGYIVPSSSPPIYDKPQLQATEK